VTAEAVHAACAAERRSLVDLLTGLDDIQWATPSLCAGWDVRTVAGHLVNAWSPSFVALLRAALRSRGRLHAANDLLARETARRPTADLVASLRAQIDRPTAPPIIGPPGPLTDVLVHAGDIRLPLNVPHEPPADRVRPALDFVTGGRPLGFVPRRRLSELRLVAEDLGQSWGCGTAVAGSGIDLLMAACGRTAVLHRLHGPGVQILRGRIAASELD
jgi:uncharacterized protein (TIGR03083 family)